MKYSIVNYCDTSNALDKRLDSEYWSPEALEAEKSIIGQPLEKYIESGYRVVYENTKIIDKTFQKENDLPFFIQSSDIEDCCINIDTVNCVSNTDWYRYPKGRIKKGEILVEVKGNVKKVAIVTDNIPDKSLVSGTLYKLSLKNISSFFVICFLSCKYGQILKNRLVCNIATPFINKEGLYNIPIPDCSTNLQNKIENIYKNSIKLKASTKVLYKQSEELLLKELDLSNWKPKHELSYVKNFSDVSISNRYDAEYFQPKYDEILEIINKNNHTTLIEQFDIIRNSGLEYDSEGKNGVIKTKQLKEYFIDFNVEDRTNQGDSNILVKNQDVLFASMGVGSLGKANIYYDFEDNNKYIIDSTLKIFRAKIGSKISPEYLDVYLHSQLAQELIYQNIVGSSGIISIYESYLQSLPIPIINRKAEEKIIENVHNAHLFNFQSKQLLEIAKRGVEIAIEENEEIATSWINEQLSKSGVNM